ncbi:MAG TPA: acyl-CoA dehydrogenase family protein [Falsiroseomonas sp.]|jgi:alkylation response protein AidB-like acyl-CoA dehydrogenase|nr:acyl-CoA dehydrogenase family protein [Falsiroseomonas sp.]
MTVETTEAIRMIRDSAAAVSPRGGDLRRIRALRFTPLGYDPAVWRQMGELGWIGLRLPEAQGGAGLGMAECCALAEELGRGLVPEPLVEGMLSAALLGAADDEDLLGRVLAGEALPVTAWQEAPDALDAGATPDAPRLFVPFARDADSFLLAVRETSGVALFLLPAQAEALAFQPMQDGSHVATVRPQLSSARRIAEDIGAVLDRALDEAALATAAYLLGVMEQAFAMTLGYLRTRQQFGRPIGSFQALQHRAVDLRIQLGLTRASMEAAAATLDALPPDAVAPRRAAVSRAKARAAEASLVVTREAVQMHGAIGYTDEYDVGLFLRKAMVLANRFGSASLHRRRCVANLPDDDEAVSAA